MSMTIPKMGVYRIPQANRAQYKPGQTITGTDKNPYYVTQNYALRNRNTRDLWRGTNMPDYVAPAAAPAPVEPTPTLPTADQSQVDLTALFPSIRAFEPENYQGSPMYKFQQERGQDALNKYYASRGLTNSSAEARGNADFMAQLGAQEAEANRNMAQLEAQRLQSMMESESQRRERYSNENWDRIYNVLQTMLAQSPFESGANAANSNAQLSAQLGDQLASILKVAATPVPAVPALPTTPLPNLAASSMGQRSDYNWVNNLANILGGVITNWKW